jgi:hypothetical protein
MEYGSLHDGLPVPRLANCREANGTERTCEFKTISFAPTPPEAFTLASYGLPAIDGRSARASRGLGTLWILTIGVVGLASAFVLKWVATTLSQRRAA